MRYDVSHRTKLTYEQPVPISHHVLHLEPRDSVRQAKQRFTLDVDPAPTHQSQSTDYYGNHLHHLIVQTPHEQLVVESLSSVEITPLDAPRELAQSSAWDELAKNIASANGSALDAAQFLFESPYIAWSNAIRDYALASFPPGRPILEAVMDLTSRIFHDFEYKGGVSDVSTPIRKVLEMRQGVCQDFAHFQIGCLRSIGLAARYVSGYLLTHPAPGKEKLIGSDASHAWLAVWAGDLGWIDFDPTNNLMPDCEHITVGWGRDYGDVSPMNGFIIGGGAHTVAVGVTVTLDETDSAI